MAYDTDTWSAEQLNQERASVKEGGFVLSNEALAMMVVARQLMHVNCSLDEIVEAIKKIELS